MYITFSMFFVGLPQNIIEAHNFDLCLFSIFFSLKYKIDTKYKMFMYMYKYKMLNYCIKASYTD